MADVTGVYMFWDYSDNNTEYTPNQKFYLDNIEFVIDYKVFDGILYDPPPPEEVIEPETEDNATDFPTAPQITVPQTSDKIVGLIILSAVGLSVVIANKKRVI
ncbi:MAG: hypothetical protein FWF15_11670 [Oscillospiraceae bacterium]|nr:hypothetical protein [Oscillospiraceae bacterium]